MNDEGSTALPDLSAVQAPRGVRVAALGAVRRELARQAWQRCERRAVGCAAAALVLSFLAHAWVLRTDRGWEAEFSPQRRGAVAHELAASHAALPAGTWREQLGSWRRRGDDTGSDPVPRLTSLAGLPSNIGVWIHEDTGARL